MCCFAEFLMVRIWEENLVIIWECLLLSYRCKWQSLNLSLSPLPVSIRAYAHGGEHVNGVYTLNNGNIFLSILKSFFTYSFAAIRNAVLVFISCERNRTGIVCVPFDSYWLQEALKKLHGIVLYLQGLLESETGLLQPTWKTLHCLSKMPMMCCIVPGHDFENFIYLPLNEWSKFPDTPSFDF
jgi:hypothetical protein